MTGRRSVLVLLVLTVAVAFSVMPSQGTYSAAVVVAAEVPEPSPGAPPEPPPEQQEPEPSPEPSPEPGPEPSPPVEDPDAPAEEPCGPFDYGCMAEEAFYGWVLSLVTSLIGMKLVDTAVGMLSTPIPAGGIEEGWQVSLAVTNTAYVLVVTIAGVLVMTNPTVQASASLKEVLPRLVLGFVGANASWFLCRMMAEFTNAVVAALLGDAASPEGVANAFARLVTDPASELLVVVLLFLVAGALQLFFLLAALIRVMLWMLLCAVAPIALAFHALPQTEAMARLWWRAVAAVLVIPVAQALVLRIAVAVFLSREQMLGAVDFREAAGSVVDVFLLISCLYVLVRIPFWAFKRVFNYQASPVVRVARFAVSMLVLRSIGKAVAAGRAAKTAKTAAPQAARHSTAAAAASQQKPATGKPRWHQPELPLDLRKPKPAQSPLPRIDSDIGADQQRRSGKRSRWYQSPLPDDGQQTARRRWRQDPVPGMPRARWRQGPIPGMARPRRSKQEPLFETTAEMRRPPRRPPPAGPSSSSSQTSSQAPPPPREPPKRYSRDPRKRPVRSRPRRGRSRRPRREEE